MIQRGNFKAHLELHSINDATGDEAITFTHTHERSATHAEFMTHRVSRNASSSRAIPRKKMDAWIQKDPALPLHFGSNKSGMQSGPEIDPKMKAKATQEMLEFYEYSRCFANRLHDHFGLHKEIANRFDELFAWINVVSTWSKPAFYNYIALRCTPYAEPRIQRLAINMLREYKKSIPQHLKPGDWHVPFIKDIKTDTTPLNTRYYGDGEIQQYIVWSTARAAWVSYQTVEEKEATWELAKKRHDDCVNLKHVTPVEHQAIALFANGYTKGTLPGFKQYRHMIPGEMTTEIDIDAILNKYEGRDYITE